tara:strand:+ start:7981 stop:8556 length:576 start_codon:yes stop_codon:yes gene_type:complete
MNHKVPSNKTSVQDQSKQRKGYKNKLRDKLRAILDDAKKNPRTDKNKNGPFFGLVLDSKQLTVDEFVELYGSNKPFKEQIVGKRTKGTVQEVSVHVPEITGVLPFPDDEWAELKDEANKILTGETLAQDVSKVKALITKIEKTINIISMYPKFYIYQQATITPDSLCQVKFTDNLESKGAGEFISVKEQVS